MLGCTALALTAANETINNAISVLAIVPKLDLACPCALAIARFIHFHYRPASHCLELRPDNLVKQTNGTLRLYWIYSYGNWFTLLMLV